MRTETCSRICLYKPSLDLKLALTSFPSFSSWQKKLYKESCPQCVLTSPPLLLMQTVLAKASGHLSNATGTQTPKAYGQEEREVNFSRLPLPERQGLDVLSNQGSGQSEKILNLNQGFKFLKVRETHTYTHTCMHTCTHAHTQSGSQIP